MGNELSKTDVEEDQDGVLPENDSELAVNIKSGAITQQSNPGVNAVKGNDKVDANQITQQENVITSSQKTIVFSPITNGINLNQPPAQSKFRMTISRPSPGHATFQANGPDVGGGNSDMVLNDRRITQASNGNAIIVQTNASGTVNQATPSLQEASVAMSEPIQEEAPKPKEISLLQRLFMPEKKVQIEVPVQNEEEGITVEQKPGLQSSPATFNLSPQNVDESMQEPVQVLSSDTATKRDSSSQTVLEGSQTTPAEEVHPIMSFFKTLVSPNKSASKSEEAKTEGDDKSKKEEQQASGNKVLEEQAVVSVSVNSEKATPPEQILIKDPVPSESNVQSQITTQTSKDDGKATKESAPRPRPFWRKGPKRMCDAEVQTDPVSILPAEKVK